MTDPVELAGKHSKDEVLSGAPRQPSVLAVEGKRCGQALLADQSFIQAISSVVLSGLSANTEKPHGSVNQTETTATKRSVGDLYGPGDMVEKPAIWWERPMTPLLHLCKLNVWELMFPLILPITIWLFRRNPLTFTKPVQPDGRLQRNSQLFLVLQKALIEVRPPSDCTNVDAVFTSRLDSYLPSLMCGLTGPDAEFKEVQDKILDIMGPLGTSHEH